MNVELRSFFSLKEYHDSTVTFAFILCCFAGSLVPVQVLGPAALWVAPFIHGSALHLLGNMFLIYIFGRMVEPNVNRLFFLLLLIGTGYLSTVVPALATGHIVIGASGCAMMLASMAAVFRLRFNLWSLLESTIIIAFSLSLTWNDLASLGKGDGISHAGHLIGVGCGLLIGLVFRRRRSLPSAPFHKPFA